MDAAEVMYAGIACHAELVRGGEASARELTEAALARISALDPELNAFRVILAERALAEADQADARRAAGDNRPLLGVPVAIKDVTDVGGEVTTWGTRAHGPPAERDAELVRRVRGAGAVIVGKTHTPEMALWPFTESATFGLTRNPWDRERTPGGSSGGAAAAVAAGMVGAAQGTDGAGSIRIPAAACGLFGLKPQRGRVALSPDDDHWHGLSVAGPIARSVADAALLLEAMATAPSAGGAPDAAQNPASSFLAAARREPARMRIAVATNPPPGAKPLHPACRRAVEETADLLRQLGHAVSERQLDYGNALVAVGGRYLRGGHDAVAQLPHPERLERRTRAFARLGAAVSPAFVREERRREGATARRLNRVLEGHDVLVMPTVIEPPHELGRYEGSGALRTLNGVSRGFGGPFTSLWNLTGQPAASVPAGFAQEGVPLAVQLVAPPCAEAILLSLAAQLEAARPWATERPPVG